MFVCLQAEGINCARAGPLFGLVKDLKYRAAKTHGWIRISGREFTHATTKFNPQLFTTVVGSCFWFLHLLNGGNGGGGRKSHLRH